VPAESAKILLAGVSGGPLVRESPQGPHPAFQHPRLPFFFFFSFFPTHHAVALPAVP
jgi:hypothetical protein